MVKDRTLIMNWRKKNKRLFSFYFSYPINYLPKNFSIKRRKPFEFLQVFVVVVLSNGNQFGCKSSLPCLYSVAVTSVCQLMIAETGKQIGPCGPEVNYIVN